VQAVEHRHEVVAAARMVGGSLGDELDVVGDARLLRALAGGLSRET
jgi:hypothetical protein